MDRIESQSRKRLSLSRRRRTPMETPGIKILEHHSVSAEEMWIIREKEESLVPPDLRDNLTVPCILTGDAARVRRILLFAQAIRS